MNLPVLFKARVHYTDVARGRALSLLVATLTLRCFAHALCIDRKSKCASTHALCWPNVHCGIDWTGFEPTIGSRHLAGDYLVKWQLAYLLGCDGLETGFEVRYMSAANEHDSI